MKTGRGRARVNQKVIRHPPIKMADTMTYLVALHEVGHCLVGMQGSRLDREAWCWQFALHQSILPIHFSDRQRISACLLRYLYRAKSRKWRVPSDAHHPFWLLLQWWQPWAAGHAVPPGFPAVQ